MNHQPNWKPEAPVIPAKLREAELLTDQLLADDKNA